MILQNLIIYQLKNCWTIAEVTLYKYTQLNFN